MEKKLNIKKGYLKKIESGQIELDPFLILKLHKPLNFELKELLKKFSFNANRIHFKKMLNHYEQILDKNKSMKRKTLGLIILNTIALMSSIVLGIVRLYDQQLIWGSLFICFIVINTYTLQNNLNIYNNIKEDEEKFKFFKNKLKQILDNL